MDLDRVYSVGMGHGGPHGEIVVSIGFRQEGAGFGVALSPAEAKAMALRVLHVTGQPHSRCATCLVAGLICGAAVAATVALIIGGVL